MSHCPSHDWDRYCDLMESPDDDEIAEEFFDKTLYGEMLKERIKRIYDWAQVSRWQATLSNGSKVMQCQLNLGMIDELYAFVNGEWKEADDGDDPVIYGPYDEVKQP